jgi:hypothetical protein
LLPHVTLNLTQNSGLPNTAIIQSRRRGGCLSDLFEEYILAYRLLPSNMFNLCLDYLTYIYNEACPVDRNAQGCQFDSKHLRFDYGSVIVEKRCPEMSTRPLT